MACDLIDVGDVLERARKGVLARGGSRGDRTKLVWNRIGVDAIRRSGVLLGETIGRAEAELAFRRVGGKARPFVDGVSQFAAQLVDLRGREQRRVVHRMPSNRQAPALDGEGENHRRALGVSVGALERGDHVAEVVAAKIADQGRQRCILVGLEDPGKRLAITGGRVIDDERANLGTALTQQTLVLGVRHAVDAALQRLTARQGEGLAQPRPVLDDLDLPTVVAEDVGKFLRAHTRNHAVEALTIEIDDPGQLPEPACGRIGQRLPDVALIQLGIAEQRHEATAGRDIEVRSHVAVDDAGEEGRSGTKTNGSSREVDRIGVLRARGIGLQTTKIAELRQVIAIETPEQVVDRMQHRRGVRLDGHPIAGLQPVEVERGHRRHHRGRRGLVATDLERVTRRSLVVGVVDHACREPEHAALN